VILLISLCVVNLLPTTELDALRSFRGQPVQLLTIIACVALFLKYTIGYYIMTTEFKTKSDNTKSNDVQYKKQSTKPESESSQFCHTGIQLVDDLIDHSYLSLFCGPGEVVSKGESEGEGEGDIEAVLCS